MAVCAGEGHAGVWLSHGFVLLKESKDEDPWRSVLARDMQAFGCLMVSFC